uniref:Uncharacterized protein n=1 Tax=Oryza rufipogon TaxID=4529 RepID=A0A0E0R545_ORYRU
MSHPNYHYPRSSIIGILMQWAASTYRDASGAGFFFGPQSRPTKKLANLRAGHPAWTLQNCLAHPAQPVGHHGIRAQTGRRKTQPQRRSRDGRRETAAARRRRSGRYSRLPRRPSIQIQQPTLSSLLIQRNSESSAFHTSVLDSS